MTFLKKKSQIYLRKQKKKERKRLGITKLGKSDQLLAHLGGPKCGPIFFKDVIWIDDMLYVPMFFEKKNKSDNASFVKAHDMSPDLTQILATIKIEKLGLNFFYPKIYFSIHF
jgi:hypothetical protein